MGFFSVFKKIFGKDDKTVDKPKLQVGESATASAETAPGVGSASPEPCPRVEKPVSAAPAPEKKSPDSGAIVGETIEKTTGSNYTGEKAQHLPGPDSKSGETLPEETEQGEERPEMIVVAETGDDATLVRLRAAEPRLSAWLDIILEGREQADEEFWRRLRFLLTALDAPQAEIDVFLKDFEKWLDDMEYVYVDEFRSELQYRLALALDLEDEEDERNRLFLKLAEGLGKTRERLGRGLDLLLNSRERLDPAFWEELEELFIMADLGYDSSVALTEKLREKAEKEKIDNPAEIKRLLRETINEIFARPRSIKAVNKPEVILLAGVNGAGKTTTIAKLAYREKMLGKKPLIVAADTFRAAAMEQLEVWAKRVGADFYAKKAGSDPAAVAWEGMDYALKNGVDTVFIDTAGRLQTKTDLMRELGKIRQTLEKKHPGSPHRSILVLDATTGQNALSQAKLFKEAAGANEIILTKLDGTAKGGVAIAVAMREELPISFVGLGEKLEDLRPFDGENFAAALLDRGQEDAA
ncbi:MAG: signal recognition particle-docking protein FtsY [Desulfovibrio sp.]|nr:signal recognition particle-docking protein FtsY [Desulfovibrio sp.]